MALVALHTPLVPQLQVLLEKEQNARLLWITHVPLSPTGALWDRRVFYSLFYNQPVSWCLAQVYLKCFE